MRRSPGPGAVRAHLHELVVHLRDASQQGRETLIRTLVQLGKALAIDTVAEGIEEQHELSLLRQEDCDSGQGFLFARPLDVAATGAFLQRWAENATPAAAPPRQMG